ncbi:MAG: M28 family peptidase [Chloroflexi bacterium]|nr:MAG: M28 family peptidase [Chloroflexota bacterium]
MPSRRLLLVVFAVSLLACSAPAGPTATPLPAAMVATAPVATETVATAREATWPPPASTATAAPEPTALPAAQATEAPTATPLPTASPEPADPFALLSLESLFATLEDLTAIQPYSGWRNSASQGEVEALDYLAARLAEMPNLQAGGLRVERQELDVFLAAELHETALTLTVAGQEVEVPADGLRGPRDDAAQALRFDSDGALGDLDPDPVAAAGPAVVVRTLEELDALGDLQGAVVFLDYALVDRSIMDTAEAVSRAAAVVEKGPAGLVLVTTYSNTPGESHGSFVGDGSALTWVDVAHGRRPAMPSLSIRLEDLPAAGIEGWDGLQAVEAARLAWDVDLVAPGLSGNLVARIPGADASRAVILGAHIDSPNAPGALDDGSGSAILLEVARVLDEARVRPPIDLYLAWFGSEELSLYGSAHFVATHQELLDRTVAMLQIDCLSRPLDGVPAELKLVSWPYGRLGDESLPWPDHLAGVAARHGVEVVAEAVYGVYSDNSSFGGYDVPHADLIYEPLPGAQGGVHYAGHLHDPYDTVELAREVGDVFEDMARVALAAALEADLPLDALRVTPPSPRRVLFLAGHTQVAHMSPATLTDLGMALAMEGFDVDLLPYGRAVTTADLQGADLVVALPPIDYALDGPEGGQAEAWSEAEVEALAAYVAGGGFLVVTNSAGRLKYGNRALDANEDWAGANPLAGRFGLSFEEGSVGAAEALPTGSHPLLEGIRRLELGGDTAVPLRLLDGSQGQVLAEAEGVPAAILVDHGQGQVLALGDLALFVVARQESQNLRFWRNLAAYVRGE